MKAVLLAVGIYILSCLVGGTVGNFYQIVGDSVARGVQLPKDWPLGVLGYNIFSFPYALLGLAPIVIAATVLRFFAGVSRTTLILSMTLLGIVIGDWMTGDNFWKNYRYLHFGALAGAVTAAMWTWLTFRRRKARDA